MSGPCAIWGSRVDNSARFSSRDAFEYDSPRAGGKYEITGSAKATVPQLNAPQKAYLTSWLIDQRKGGNRLPAVTTAEVERAKVGVPKGLIERAIASLRRSRITLLD